MHKNKVRSTYNCRNRIIYGTKDSAINLYYAMSIEKINVGLGLGIYKVQTVLK